MSGNGTVNAELVIRMRDQTAAGSAAVVRSAEQTEQKATTATERAAQRSAEATERGAARQRTAFERLSTARESLGVRSEQRIQREIQQTEAAYNRLAQSGMVGARELARAQDASISRVRELRREMGEVEKLSFRQRMSQAAGNGSAVAGGVYGAFRVERSMLSRFSDLEQAQAELRISMTDKRGGVSSQYGRTLDVAERLGNLLPGTTRDFVLEAQALKQKGISDSTIANGGLQAAGLLRVGMGMRGEGEAGELVAKTMHSFGLKDSELGGAADHTFRLYKAFGTKARDITEANTYMGGTLNQLGWTGADNMRKVQAMQGMLAAKGLESSVFGTNFADMLSFVARNETRLKGKGAETKEVNAILGAHGIKLDLFDKKGKFVDPDEFMKQMQKLQVLSQKEMIEVFHKLFGTQGERVATALVQGGTRGVKEAEDKVDNIISLTDAVKQQTDTWAGKTEALSGSMDNMLAALGKPIGDALKPAVDKLNEAVGGATDFFKEHPAVAGAVGVSAAVVGGAATWTLLGTLLGGVGVPVRVVGSAGLPPSMPGGLPPSGRVIPGVSKVLKVGGVAGTVALAGDAALEAGFGEDSAVTRYGTTALNGAAIGATVGSAVPIVGTSIGAITGGVIALIMKGMSDFKQSEFDRRRSEMRAELEVTVKDDRVEISRSKIEGDGVTARMKAGPSSPTGNIRTGAPQ